MKLFCKVNENLHSYDDGSLVKKLLDALVGCKPWMHGVKFHVYLLLAYGTGRCWG